MRVMGLGGRGVVVGPPDHGVAVEASECGCHAWRHGRVIAGRKSLDTCACYPLAPAAAAGCRFGVANLQIIPSVCKYGPQVVPNDCKPALLTGGPRTWCNYQPATTYAGMTAGSC